MSWWTIIAMAVGAYAFKAFGMFGLSRIQFTGTLNRLVQFLPAALFAGLIVQQTLTDGTTEVVLTRIVGVAAGGIAVWRRAPLLVVIAVSAAVAGGLRALL